MKWRYQWLYQAGLAVLLAATFWAVWANAQGATNPAVNGAADAPTLPFPHWTWLPSHALSFGLDQVNFLCEFKLLGEPAWKYLASLIYIVLAFFAAKLLDYVVNVWLKRFAAKTETQLDDLLLELLHGPVKVVGFVILLNIGLGVFEWPMRAQIYIARGFILIVACSVTYVALKVVDLLLGIWRAKIIAPPDKAFAEQLLPFIGKVAKSAIIVTAVMLAAENLELPIKSLLAGLSVGGLALGLAAQDTVANLFGAVAIFMDKPFHIGDRINVEGVDGTVESIGLRSTRIRNLDGHHVTVPNKLMGNAIITNITRRPTIKTEMNLGLTYDTPVEKVRRATVILEEVFRANPQTADLTISFNKFGDSALNVLVIHIWNGTDARAHFAAMQEWNLEIKQRFDAEKIELAFPTRTVHLKS